MLKFLQSNKSTFLYTLYISIAPLCFSSLILYWVSKNEYIIHSISPIQWCGLFGISIITMSLSITPTTFISMLSGYFLGLKSVIPVAVCYLFASIISYYLVKLINNKKIMEYIYADKKSKKLFESLRKDEFKIIFFTRISPIFPFSITNLLLSISNVGIKNFILASFLGMLPRTILSIIAGSKVVELQNIGDSPLSSNWQEWVFLFLIFISIFGLGYTFKKMHFYDKTSE